MNRTTKTAAMLRAAAAVSLLASLLSAVPASAGARSAPNAVERLSRFRTLAVVERVDVKHRDIKGTRLEVHFKRVKAVAGEVPRKFKLCCMSTDAFWQRPPADGPRIFHPRTGDKVFVTALRAGGEMTSYTKLDTQLLQALLGRPESVRIINGKAVVAKEEKKDSGRRRRRTKRARRCRAR